MRVGTSIESFAFWPTFIPVTAQCGASGPAEQTHLSPGKRPPSDAPSLGQQLPTNALPPAGRGIRGRKLCQAGGGQRGGLSEVFVLVGIEVLLQFCQSGVIMFYCSLIWMKFNDKLNMFVILVFVLNQ